MELVFENPLACHNVGAGRTRDETPSLIINQRLILLGHGSPPLRVSEGTLIVCQNW